VQMIRSSLKEDDETHRDDEQQTTVEKGSFGLYQ
jgi:hypothetical protein